MMNNALIKRIKEKEKNIGGPERKEDQRESGAVLTVTQPDVHKDRLVFKPSPH